MESHNHERAEFDSPDEKLAHDAEKLVEIAAVRSERIGIPVNPLSLAGRKDDDIEALRKDIEKEQWAVRITSESVEVDLRLATFKADYDSNAALKAKIKWQEIEARLLANNGYYLVLAQAMEQGGVLFGVDKAGNPLIADKGDEPIMGGMSYKDTRDRVLYKHDRYDIDGQMQRDAAGQPVPTEYEMFGYIPDYNKSPEITDYESHTGKPFVKSPNGDEWRSSWVESGENPSWPRNVRFNPRVGYACVRYDASRNGGFNRGVRRLLRVKQT